MGCKIPGREGIHVGYAYELGVVGRRALAVYFPDCSGLDIDFRYGNRHIGGDAMGVMIAEKGYFHFHNHHRNTLGG